MVDATAPRFSIVVPCYNVRAWLRPCLDSLLTQSYGDLEVIGVDDASPDDSGNILDEYAAADPRVRVVHLTENVGLGLARNAGMRECRGDYLLFLDSDDTMVPGSLEAIAARLEETGEPDILMFDYERVFWDGKVVRNLRHDAFAREGSGVFTAAERPVFLTFLEVVWNKAYRRDFLDRHGFAFTAGYYEDAPWTYATMLTAERIATLDRIVVHYRQRRAGGNILASRNRKHFDVFDQYERVNSFVASKPELASWRRFVFDRSLDHILTVIGRPERLHPDDRAEFFHAAAAFAKRWKPEGYSPDRTRRGFKRWLLVRDDYATYAAMHLGSKLVRAGKQRARAVGRAPGTASRFAAELPPVKNTKGLRTVAGALRRRGLEAVPYRVSRAAQLDPDLAVFGAYWFKAFGCSPRAIYEKATELIPSLRGVWVVHPDTVEVLPEGVEYVVASTPAYYSLLSKATYFVNNVNFGDDLVKRDGQVHLQTHHGTPLKTMGVDLRQHPVAAAGMDIEDLLRRVDRWDYSLSSNRYSSEVWGRAVPASYETLEYGYPRNDRLLTSSLDDVRAIRDSLGFDDSHLVVLYAPTFRDGHDAVRTSNGVRDLGGLGIHLDLHALAGALGDDGRVLVRTHYSLSQPVPTADGERVIDVSNHPRVEDLYLAADVLVTDYSSLMFDYANLDLPIVLLADDWEQYLSDRGTYFDIFELPPGVVARSQADLVAAFTDGTYAGDEAGKQRQAFREKFCEFDDGRAAERVVRKVFLGESPAPITPPADRHPAPSPYGLGR